MNRRNFLTKLSLASAAASLPSWAMGFRDSNESPFARHLKPVGRALELEGYYVWCNSPIQGPDNKIHVYFSRLSAKKGMSGWINGCEIAHAVADTPESDFAVTGTILAPRPGFFDATTCHNPSIKLVDGKYCLFYMGNSNGKTNTKRIGLAIADSPYGPWKRTDKPLLEAGAPGEWDDHCTTNPSYIKHPNGQYWLYYKSWNTKDYETSPDPAIRGNRKYGLAIAERLEGPYTRYPGNPVIDFSKKGGNKQFEDAFVWLEKGKFKMVARDMGVFNHEVGLIMDSNDGIKWSEPKIAWYGADRYIQQPPPPPHLKRYGRFERPQILFLKGKPAYLFTTSQGGKYMTASSFIFKIT